MYCFSEWFIFGIFTSPIWGIFLFDAWEFSIKPRLIPKEKIDGMADQLIAEHGPRAAHRAYIEEDRAWRRCDALQQGIWRRVRRELQRREAG